MEFQGFRQIFKRFLFGLTLARDIYFKTLRYEPFALLPHTGCKPSFHCSCLRWCYKNIISCFASLLSRQPLQHFGAPDEAKAEGPHYHYGDDNPDFLDA